LEQEALKKPKRQRRLHSIDQMRSLLRKKINASSLSQAEFAVTQIGEDPASLSMTLTGARGLSRPQRAYLGVKREIMYRQDRP
jgi:hypothetical protein